MTEESKKSKTFINNCIKHPTMEEEIKLCDIVNNVKKVEMPDLFRKTLIDIYNLSLDFKETVIDLRVATYEPEKDRYRLYFSWKTSSWGSNKCAYIAYDKQEHDFFDWLIDTYKEPPRFNQQQLLEYFKKEF